MVLTAGAAAMVAAAVAAVEEDSKGKVGNV